MKQGVQVTHQLRIIAETESEGSGRLLRRYHGCPVGWNQPGRCFALRLKITRNRHRFAPGQSRINRLHRDCLERHDLAGAVRSSESRGLARDLLPEITREQVG